MRYLMLLSAALASLPAWAQEGFAYRPAGGDFEATEVGTFPPGWGRSGDKSVSWEVISENPHGGQHCLRAVSDGARAYISSPRTVVIPGRRYTYYVHLRSQPPGVQARLYLDAGRVEGRHRYWSADAVPGGGWREFELSLTIPEEPGFDEAQLTMRLDILSKGELCADDFVMEDTTDRLSRGEQAELERARERSAAKAEIIFYLLFDGAWQASEASGSPDPLEAEGLSFAPGLMGQAAVFADAPRLTYACAGNVRKDHGTVSLWFQSRWDQEQPAWAAWFSENPPNEPGGNRLWFWKYGSRVRFDVRDPWDHLLMTACPRFSPGEWHHLAATWDCERGSRLFIDGVAFYRMAHAGEARFTWPTVEHEFFMIGADPSRADSSIHGLIDEFKLYDDVLSPADIAAEFRRVMPVDLNLDESIFRAGEQPTLRIAARNRSDAAQSARVSWRLLGPDDQELDAGVSEAMNVPAGGRASFTVLCPALGPGEYRLDCTWQGEPPRFTSLHFYARHPRAARDVVDRAELDEGRLKLVAEVDCTADLTAERFAQWGESRVVTSGAGRYREADAKRWGRIAFRLQAAAVGSPHLLVVEYPDDKERIFDVLVNSKEYPITQDCWSGVICGRELANSGRMTDLPILLWPRETDFAVVLTTWEEGHPAAVSRIRLYEVQGELPRLKVTDFDADDPRRVGLYWEDPTINNCYGRTGPSSGVGAMPHFEATISRCLDQLAFSGQNLVTYPLTWYTGPLYPSLDVEMGKRGLAADRHPGDFVEFMLDAFAEEGVGLIGEIRTFVTHSLIGRSQTNMALVRAGEPTYNMIRDDGSLVTSTFHARDPVYNPLASEVRENYQALIDEILNRYGRHKAFLGINLIFHTAQPIWFGSIHSGYGDANCQRFAGETGIELPFDAKEPFRFRKRAKWILDNHREEWIAWRCRHVTDWILQLNERVRRFNPRLRLYCTIRLPQKPDHLARIEAGEATAEDYVREAGLDLPRARNVEGLVIDYLLNPCDGRWWKANARSMPEAWLKRDIDFDPTRLGFYANPGRQMVCFHNRYFESPIGRQEPIPGYWWGSFGWRAGANTPTREHFLEYYAQALNAFDAGLIASGGFTVGTVGHDREVERFARAFRALPNAYFQPHAASVEPLAVRHASLDGKGYFYLLNTSGAELEVRLALADAGEVHPLCPDTRLNVSASELAGTLAPYELAAYECGSPEPKLGPAQVTLPDWQLSRLQARLEELRALAAGDERGEQVIRECEDLLQAKRYRTLEVKLWSYHPTRLEGVER